MKEFRGKVAVITGAGRGIGRGIAERCAQEGMNLVLAGIGMESLNRAESELKAQGATVISVQTDVSKVEDVERLAERTLSEFGGVHLLVNNAGVGFRKTIREHTLADWQWVIDVNLWGVIYGIHAFLPIMIEQDVPCHIVNVSSIAGLILSQRIASYSVTKYAVVTLTETLHMEMLQAGTKVKASVFCPGFVQSDIADAERNRPSNLQNDPDEQLGTATLEARASDRESINEAMTAAEATDHVFQALKKDQLYILSHSDGNKAIRKRTEYIINQRNPGLNFWDEDE